MVILNYSLFISHLSFGAFAGHVAAKWFFGEIITGGLVSPGTASAAYALKFARIAFSREFIIVAQIFQYFRSFPDIDKRLLPHVAAISR